MKSVCSGPGWELGECRQCRSGEHLDVNLIADQPLAPGPGQSGIVTCHYNIAHQSYRLAIDATPTQYVTCNYCNVPTWKYHNVTTSLHPYITT